MTIDQTQYFDLYNIIVNELIGDVWLAVLLGLVLLFFFTIKTKMPYQLSIMFSLLFLAVMFEGTNFLALWTFIVLVAGTLYYYSIARALEV